MDIRYNNLDELLSVLDSLSTEDLCKFRNEISLRTRFINDEVESLKLDARRLQSLEFVLVRLINRRIKEVK